MEPPNLLDRQWMKNYAGQIALVPTQMLQACPYPFGFREGLKLASSGYKLDIAFANKELFNQDGHQHFDDCTPLLVMKRYVNLDEDDARGTNHVIDIATNRARNVADADLNRPFARPWDVLVDLEELDWNYDNWLRLTGKAGSLPRTFPGRDYLDRWDWIAAVSLLQSSMRL